MENQGNPSNQSRFMMAAVLSMVVLFGWSYFFAPTKPAGDANANANTAANTAAPVPAPTIQAPATPAEPTAVAPETTPARTITIKSPLYEVTLDSKGAVATSWLILRNRTSRGDLPVYADGSNSANEKPLQLIGQEALSRNPREVPFRLMTDDAAVTTAVNDRNYQISVPEETVSLAAGQERQIDFT